MHPRALRPTPPASAGESPEEPGAASAVAPDRSTSVDWVFGRTLLHAGEAKGVDANIELKTLLERVRQLEWQLKNGKPPPGPVKGKKRPMRGMLEKTRFFGPSHWSNAVNLVCFVATVPSAGVSVWAP